MSEDLFGLPPEINVSECADDQLSLSAHQWYRKWGSMLLRSYVETRAVALRLREIVALCATHTGEMARAASQMTKLPPATRAAIPIDAQEVFDQICAAAKSNSDDLLEMLERLRARAAVSAELDRLQALLSKAIDEVSQ